MGHTGGHSDHDECAALHGTESNHSHNHSDDSDQEHLPSDDSGSTHHHGCCHLHIVDRFAPSAYASVVYVIQRVNFSGYDSLFPDSPVFSLDKPPLI